jgi:hypothetical protein
MHMLCRTQQAKTDLAMNSKSGDGNFWSRRNQPLRRPKHL